MDGSKSQSSKINPDAFYSWRREWFLDNYKDKERNVIWMQGRSEIELILHVRNMYLVAASF